MSGGAWAGIAQGGGTIIDSILDLGSNEANRNLVRHQNQLQERLYYDNKQHQERLQKEFAKNSIQWKADDATKAGLNPLYALGSGSSYSPAPMAVMGGGQPNTLSSTLGQNISRAFSAHKTEHQKQMEAMSLTNAKLDIDGKALDNQIRAQKLKTLQLGSPSMPPNNTTPGADNFIPGQGNSGVLVKPKERASSQKGRLAQEAGWVPDVGYSRTDTGLTPVVPNSLSESLEDDIIGKALWRLRNQIAPNFTGLGKPSKSQLPKWADDWTWNGTKQEWQPVKGKGSFPMKKWNKFWRKKGSQAYDYFYK